MYVSHFQMFIILWWISGRAGQFRAFRRPQLECGYKMCTPTKFGALNVHVVPHSHMDIGWVKTFDQYYYGTNAEASTANVQLIYHTVLSELLHDRRRKFTFSEVAYFWRWWKEQRVSTRRTFRSLVQEGRVEFAGGGWVQNDEATTHYASTIDQMTWGLRKLNDSLGPCGKPRAAWQVDTYGHSREHASLMAQMGYDGIFLGRVDYKEREAMMDEDRMEAMWRGSDVLGKMSDLMTHTLYNLYNAPEGFCFDNLCSDEPIVDDPDDPNYNAAQRVEELISYLENQARHYDHDNIILTMGGDFTYQNAASWYINIDKLINLVNSHTSNLSDIHMFYSTPSCYLKAVYLSGRREKTAETHTERGDHFPYSSDANTYWSGFYTSRPSLKLFEKEARNIMQVTKQLAVLTQSRDSVELHLMRHAHGLMQHHDAITGTSQQHVSSDYSRMLYDATTACSKKLSQYIGSLTVGWFNVRRMGQQTFTMCHRLNVSECWLSENAAELVLLVYNPLSESVTHYVRLPVLVSHYSINDANSEELEFQLIPLTAADISIPGRQSNAIQELWFEAANIPPLGYSAYRLSSRVTRGGKDNSKIKTKRSKEIGSDAPFIANQFLKVTIDNKTGLLQSIQTKDGLTVGITQTFLYYSQGSKINNGMSSGAYSFRPLGDAKLVSDRTTYEIVRGPLVKEIKQRFSDWLTQVIRLYRSADYLELEWIVGPVPIGSDVGKEVVSRFVSNFSAGGVFYTDSNGRQMMRRSCGNDTIQMRNRKPLPACYLPVTSRISVRDLITNNELTVLTDRPQGGTSYRDGEIELMVHRRLLTDDGFGLEEALNEEAYGVGEVVRGKHRIVIGDHRHSGDQLSSSEKAAIFSRRFNNQPLLFLASAETVFWRKWLRLNNKQFSGLTQDGLPPHVHILTLEPWKGGAVLLRLENTLEKERDDSRADEDPGNTEVPTVFSSMVTVDLRKIFAHLWMKSARETTLGANQWLNEARQMDWSTRFIYDSGEYRANGTHSDDFFGATENPRNLREDSEETYENVLETQQKNGNNYKHKNYDENADTVNTGNFYDNKTTGKPVIVNNRNIINELNENTQDTNLHNVKSEVRGKHDYGHNDEGLGMVNRSRRFKRNANTKYFTNTFSEKEIDLNQNKSKENLPQNETVNKIKNIDLIQSIRYIISTNPNLAKKLKEKIYSKSSSLKSDETKKYVFVTETSTNRKYNENITSTVTPDIDPKLSDNLGNTAAHDHVTQKEITTLRQQNMEDDQADEISTEIDDGVTKSIYEMYYNPRSLVKKDTRFKRRQRRNRFRKNPRRYGTSHRAIIDNRTLGFKRFAPKQKSKIKREPIAYRGNATEKLSKRDINEMNLEPTNSVDATKLIDQDKSGEEVIQDLKSFSDTNAFDIYKDIIPKANLAKMRAKRRRGELVEYPDMNDDYLNPIESQIPDDAKANLYDKLEPSNKDTIRPINQGTPKRRIKRTSQQQRRGRKVRPNEASVADTDTDTSDDQFIITLRPTQIRTFVVHFDVGIN